MNIKDIERTLRAMRPREVKYIKGHKVKCVQGAGQGCVFTLEQLFVIDGWQHHVNVAQAAYRCLQRPPKGAK